MPSNDPLFVADLATLKERLRLTGVPAAATDTLAIIDEAVLRARLAFHRRLGTPRVNELLAITYTVNPGDKDGVLRALANSVEIDLVRCELMQRLPQAFMDASGDINKRWNEEAPFRERSPLDLGNQLKSLKNRLEEDFQMLAEEESLGDEVHGKAFSLSPDTAAPRPGDSLRFPSSTGIIPED